MKLNIVSGGYAIPLGNNFFLMQGNKHNKGEKRTPTDLTYYNKGGGIKQGSKLEVEGGEIEQKLPGELRVFSAQPMINGQSPASLIMQGANPDKVFSIQQSLNGNHKGKTAEKGGIISWVKSLFGANDNQEEKEKKEVNYDFSKLVTTRNRPYDSNRAVQMFTKLLASGISPIQASVMLASGIEESGLNPYAVAKKNDSVNSTGILQWDPNRYTIANKDNEDEEFERQVDFMIKTADANKTKEELLNDEWTDGGKGSGYQSWKNAYEDFINDSDVNKAVKGYTLGHVRPSGKLKSVENRTKLANQIYDIYKAANNIEQKFGGKIKTSNNMSKNNFKLADIASGLTLHSTGEQKQFKCGGRKKLAIGDSIIDDSEIDYENMPTVIANYPTGLIAPIKGFDVASPAYPEIKANIPNINYSNDNNDSNDDTKTGSFRLSDPEGFWSSVASVGSNALSAGLGWITNRAILDRLSRSFRKAPVPIIAPKLKTQYNIEPQLADIRSMLARSEEDINANTASSRVGLARKQRVRTAANAEINKLYGQKENVETQLINADRIQQYENAKLNAQRYDDWREKENLFQLGLIDKRGENTMGLINNLNRGVQDFIGNMRQQRNFKNTLAAQMMTNPDAAKLFTDKDNKSLIDYINRIFR